MILSIILAAGATVLTVFVLSFLAISCREWRWRRAAPHVRLIPSWLMYCENCGHKDALFDPTRREFIDRTTDFRRNHAGCKKKVTHAG